jgi:hypothetical protein
MQGRQAGQALLIFLALLAVIIVAASVTVARGTQQSTSFRAAQTQVALNAAKQALVGYAAGVALTCPSSGCFRPGELPCPDLVNNGLANAAGCANANQRLGRLPWKTLGLPDLRDGSGERLWYAVSSSFVNNPRTGYAVSSSVVIDPSTACTTPNATGCLNSNTSGTITVRDQSGMVVNDGANQATAAIAVVIAPGSALSRFDGTAQDRSCAGDGNMAFCLQNRICSSVNTALCKPINYLDISPSGEDNMNFTDGSSTDGFITGPILGSSNVVVLNDVVTAVSYADLMPVVQRRVAQEVMNCLQSYAIDSSGNPNVNGGYGHYPWAVDATTAFPVNGSSTFFDTEDIRFGHVPDNQWLTKTQWSLRQPPLSYTATNSLYWPATCAMGGGVGVSPAAWWMNWKAVVFYAVAQGYSPDATPLGCTGTNCLTVNPPSTSNSTKVVVLVAGRALAGQSRTSADLDTPSMYLELTNPTSDPAGLSNTTYQAAQTSPTFNDVVVYQ